MEISLMKLLGAGGVDYKITITGATEYFDDEAKSCL
jgi:hypothetical protein